MPITTSKQKPRPDYNAIYGRQFITKMLDYDARKGTRRTLKQLVYYGVKYIITMPDGNAEYFFNSVCVIQNYISQLTPRELITVFPIDKDFDGHKYESKDYFYTMKVLKAIGMDEVIGHRIDTLLWDYMNFYITMFNVKKFLAVSDLRKTQGQKGLMAEWVKMNNIPTYTLSKNPATGAELLTKDKTGETHSINTSRIKVVQSKRKGKGDYREWVKKRMRKS